MNEQAGGLEVDVAGEVQVIDLGPFKGFRLLGSHVGREEKESIVSVFGRQDRPSAVQLIGYDRDILVTEVSFLFDKVSDSSADGGLPCQDGVKTVQRAGR